VPSLAETIAWIKDALASHGTVVNHRESRQPGEWEARDEDTIRLMSATGCALVFEDTSESTHDDRYGGHSTRTSSFARSVNLRDVDPTTIHVNNVNQNFSVGFQTTNLANVIDVNGSTPSGNRSYKATGMVLRVDSNDVATRLMKALLHATSLCGAKKSIF